MREKNTLIVMARPPELGKVKTRLAAAIGEEKTLRIYIVLLEKVKSIATQIDAKTAIFWTHYPVPVDFAHFNNHIQSAGDLGAKMHSAFNTISLSTNAPMVMIGTDCYDLNSEIATTAFEALDRVDVVIGPAMDGGYYLIGMKQVHQDLFQSMPWSTSLLLETTIARMRELQLSFILLPKLRDIDEVTDAMATDDLRAYLI
ncbi:MAG: TIGR04282 family arsenosugar biosynthesis glycosyltransferase [Flavobacteriales bacterium]